MDIKQTLLPIVIDYMAENKEEFSIREYNFLVSLLSILDKESSYEPIQIELPSQEYTPVIISCDASTTKNKSSAIATIIENPLNEEPFEIVRFSRMKTNNKAEYEAIYVGLSTFVNQFNNTHFPIEVRSDSQLAINQLNQDWECKDDGLKRLRDNIWELANSVEGKVIFVWRQRNSTKALKRANNLAQEFLGVSKH